MFFFNNYNLFNGFCQSTQYNPESDVIFSGFNSKSNFNAYFIYVIKNGKQFTTGNNKIVITNYTNTDGNWCRLYGRTSSGADTALSVYAFKYENNLWRLWYGNTFYDGDAFTNSVTHIVKANFNLWHSGNDTSLVVPATSYDNIPIICNTDEQLSNFSVGELAILDNDIAPSKIVITLIDNSDVEIRFSVSLTDYSDYISRIDVDDPFSDLGYVIPWSAFPEFNFVQGHQYTLSLVFEDGVPQVKKSFVVSKSIANADIPPSRPLPTPEPTSTPDPNQGLIDSNKETQNILNDQTNAIKENTETNKNIFQKIGDILSFINPFSENFFGRKLVELIIDGIKGLFIPEDNFFSNYFDEIKQWFSDRLGFLWAPFDLLIELLNRMLSINFSEPKFNIPDINEPFTNNKIISAQEFNFNELLENNVIKTVHDIYLILVDAFIVFNLYKLAQDKLEEVFTK